MTSFDKIIEYIESRNGKMLSTSYIDNRKFLWSCENNHINKSSRQMLYRKSWCRQCSLDLSKDKTIKSIKSGYTLLNYSTTICHLKCDNGHYFKMTPGHIIEGNKCSICHKDNLKKGTTRLSLIEVNNRLSKLGFKFLDDNFKSLRTLHTIRCNNGHIFKKQLQHVITKASGCPDCNNYLKSENKIRTLIESKTGLSFIKTRPDWLINPETGYRLELDGYCEKIKTAFEYDGHFHYEVRSGLNNNLQQTKKLDLLKNKLCEKQGVKLIRIPYFLKENEIIQLIEKEINLCG